MEGLLIEMDSSNQVLIEWVQHFGEGSGDSCSWKQSIIKLLKEDWLGLWKGFIPGSHWGGFLIICIGSSLESSPHFVLLQVVHFASLPLLSHPLGSFCERVVCTLKGLKAHCRHLAGGVKALALHCRNKHVFALLS